MKKIILLLISVILFSAVVNAGHNFDAVGANFVMGIEINKDWKWSELKTDYTIQIYVNSYLEKDLLRTGHDYNFLVDDFYIHNRYYDDNNVNVNDVDWKNSQIMDRVISDGYESFAFNPDSDNWIWYYTYKYQKNQVCNNYVETAQTYPASYFLNTQFADTFSCDQWDGSWVYDDELRIKRPDHDFPNSQHVYPDNMNFGEPPILLKSCTVSCDLTKETVDETGDTIYSGEGKLFDFIDFFGDSKYSYVPASGYYNNNRKGRNVFMHEEDCGQWKSGEFTIAQVSCIAYINPNARGNTVLDSTVLFDDYFSTGNLSIEADEIKISALVAWNPDDNNYERWTMVKKLHVPMPIEDGWVSPLPDNDYTPDDDNNNLPDGWDMDGDTDTPDNKTRNNIVWDGYVDGQVLSQTEINLQILSERKKNSFFSFLIKITELTLNMILIVAYVLQLMIIIWVFFVVIPGIFHRFLTLIKNMLNIKLR